jgi:uncharacterized protein YecT (DUF1311 family)
VRSMVWRGLAPWALMVGSMVGQPAAAQVADCVDLSRPICMQRALERTDRELNAIYSGLMSALDPARREKLREEQREWIRSRNATCKVPSSET